MTITEIKRVSLTTPPEPPTVPDELRMELLDVRAQAAEELGYNHKDAKPPFRERDETNPLMQAIQRAEIDVLYWRDVLRYQMEAAHAADREAVEKSLKRDDYPDWGSGIDHHSWTSTPLEKYAHFVPDYVLQKALALRRECPEVKFGVLSLGHDPFLVAFLGEKPDSEWSYGRRASYFIEVWDEAAFAPRG
jgi:hypothetical protein